MACVITSLILMTDAVRILHLKNDEMQGSKYVVEIESVQDLLCELGMKPCMHLVEISIFSLNHDIVRPTNLEL